MPGPACFVSVDALQVHARQALRRQHVRSHRLADLGNRRLDQLELHPVAAVPVVIVVVVGETGRWTEETERRRRAPGVVASCNYLQRERPMRAIAAPNHPSASPAGQWL